MLHPLGHERPAAGKLEELPPASMVEELEDASAWEVVSEPLV